MAEVIVGMVTEVQPRASKDGSKTYYDVWVASGRSTVKTAGIDHEYTMGEQVAIEGSFAAARFGGGVEFSRVRRLVPEDVNKIFGGVFGLRKPNVEAVRNSSPGMAEPVTANGAK